MKVVTDPNLLSQLNSSGNSSHRIVTDPNLLAQLNSKPLPSPPDDGMVDTFLGKMPRNYQAKPGDPFFIGRTPEEKQKESQIEHDRRMGALQSLANTPIEIINLLKKNPLQKFDFAPKNRDAEMGGYGGDIASFFMPGEAVNLAAKGLTYLPKVGKGVNSLLKSIEASPFLRGTASVGRTAGEAGIYNARKNPNEPLIPALEGMTIGGGTQLAANLLTSQNPLVRLMARLGVGAGMGQMFGHPYYGAAAGLAAPELTRAIGITGKNSLAQDALEGLQYKDIARAKAANNRLNTTVTPAQASGNYPVASYEGSLKRSPEGSQYAYRQEKLQEREQNQSINKMLDDIYMPTPKNEKEISDLYAKANLKNMPQANVDKFKSNPIIRDAFAHVKNNPAFENIPENNYEFLAEVDRQLYRDYNAALRNQPNTAHAINQVKEKFNQSLKNANKDYESATKSAQPRIVRRNIETKFNKMDEDMTGKNFYNKFLNTRKAYQDILRDTKNFPQAQAAIKDMRQGWKHLSNIKTVSQGEAQSKAAISQARDQWKALLEAIKRYSGARNDVQGLKFIYSKEWDKGFDKIMQIKDQAERNRKIATLLGKIAIINGLEMDEPSEK